MPLLEALQVPLLSGSALRSVVPLQLYHSNELNALVSAALPAAQRLLHACLPALAYGRAAQQLVPRLLDLRCFRWAVAQQPGPAGPGVTPALAGHGSFTAGPQPCACLNSSSGPPWPPLRRRAQQLLVTHELQLPGSTSASVVSEQQLSGAVLEGAVLYVQDMADTAALSRELARLFAGLQLAGAAGGGAAAAADDGEGAGAAGTAAQGVQVEGLQQEMEDLLYQVLLVIRAQGDPEVPLLRKGWAPLPEDVPPWATQLLQQAGGLQVPGVAVGGRQEGQDEEQLQQEGEEGGGDADGGRRQDKARPKMAAWPPPRPASWPPPSGADGAATTVVASASGAAAQTAQGSSSEGAAAPVGDVLVFHAPGELPGARAGSRAGGGQGVGAQQAAAWEQQQVRLPGAEEVELAAVGAAGGSGSGSADAARPAARPPQPQQAGSARATPPAEAGSGAAGAGQGQDQGLGLAISPARVQGFLPLLPRLQQMQRPSQHAAEGDAAATAAGGSGTAPHPSTPAASAAGGGLLAQHAADQHGERSTAQPAGGGGGGSSGPRGSAPRHAAGGQGGSWAGMGSWKAAAAAAAAAGHMAEVELLAGVLSKVAAAVLGGCPAGLCTPRTCARPDQRCARVAFPARSRCWHAVTSPRSFYPD
jgi:hypothetical protein